MLSVNSIAQVLVNVVRSLGSASSFDTGLIMVEDAGTYVEAHRAIVCNSTAEAIQAMRACGYTSTDSEAYKAVVKYFAASPAPSKLIVSGHPSSETLAEALEAVLNITSSFYGVTIGNTETQERILALDTYITSLHKPLMFFVPITEAVSAATGSGHTLQVLYGRDSKRALPFVCSALSDAVALMGTAMGLALSHANSAFSLCYKTINGVQPIEATEQQVNAIKALNGNIYLTRGYTHLLLEQGTVSSGERYDDILYMDMISLYPAVLSVPCRIFRCR